MSAKKRAEFEVKMLANPGGKRVKRTIESKYQTVKVTK